MRRNRAKFRMLSLIFSFSILITTLFAGVSNVVAEGELNFYTLKGVLAGSATPPTQGPWYYEARDFSAPQPFMRSDDHFNAPAVEILSNETSAKIRFSAIADATQYRIDVYDAVNGLYSFRSSINTTGTTVTITDLEANSRVAVQVVAYAGSAVSSASQVRECLVDYNYVVLNDLSDISTVNPDGNYSEVGLISGVSPDGDCLTATMNNVTWKSVTFSLNASEAITNVQAVAYWVDFENNTNAYTWASGSPYLFDGDGTDISATLLNNTPKNASLQFTLISSVDGSVSTGNNSDGRCVIPAGFKGYVLVPVATGNESFDFSSVATLTLKEDGYSNTASLFTGTKICIDSIGVVKDVNAFKTNGPGRVFSVIDQTIFGCSNYTTDYVYNSAMSVGYTLKNTTTERSIRFNPRDTGTKQYGMSLRFTAPYAATFDVGGALEIIGNTTPGKVYYRIMKQNAAGLEYRIWPDNQEWYTLTATASSLNPKGVLEPAQVTLAMGESIRIEAYADADSAAGGIIPIRAGNPVVTIVNKQTIADGTSTVYNVFNYHYLTRTDGNSNYVTSKDRWNYEALDMSTGSPVLLPYTTYNASWGNDLYISGSGVHREVSQLKFELAANKGVSMCFVAPESGEATIYLKRDNFKATDYLRVLKNDQVIFPSTNGWDGTAGTTTVNPVCSVQKGDKIYIQSYCTVGTNQYVGQPTVTLTTTTDAAVETVKNSIDTIGKVTPGSGAAITAAKAAYDALSADQKAQVTNKNALPAVQTIFETYCPRVFGATIRMTGEQGLRFGTKFNVAAAEQTGYSIVGYGTVLMAKSKWLASGGGELLQNRSGSVFRQGTVLNQGQSVMEYGVTLIKIPKANHLDDVMARSYIVYENNTTHEKVLVYNSTGTDEDAVASKAFICNIQEIADYFHISI